MSNENPNNNPYVNNAANGFDHTSEYDAKDISDNKVVAMLVYLLGIVGVFLAMLDNQKSPYVAFHVRQCLKITVCEVLVSIATVILSWTVIVPFVGGIAVIVLLVLRIIGFVTICQGKATEVPIVRSFGFLK